MSVVQGPDGSVMPGVTPPSYVSNRATPPGEPPAQGVPADKVFTAEDIENARKQEKTKVYSRLDELQQRLSVFEEERKQREQADEEARKAAEEDAERRRQEELSLAERLEEQRREFEARLEAERQQRESALALLERERAFQELERYRLQAINAHADDILPELLDYVTGDTPEAIDASVAGLVERTARILENTTNALSAQRQAQPGARVTAPPVGPMEIDSGQRQLSAADIANMSMPEYEKYRSQLLGLGSSATNRGLFG